MALLLLYFMQVNYTHVQERILVREATTEPRAKEELRRRSTELCQDTVDYLSKQKGLSDKRREEVIKTCIGAFDEQFETYIDGHHHLNVEYGHFFTYIVSEIQKEILK